VKSRIAGLLGLLEDVCEGREPDPASNCVDAPPGLFDDTEKKFPSTPPNKSQVQGVWVVSAVLCKTDQLLAQFGALDSSKVQFAVMSNGWFESESFVQYPLLETPLSLHFSLPPNSALADARIT
jgi:hypothetical protein